MEVLDSKSMGFAKRKASYADIEGLPEGQVGELIDGDLYVSPRPRVAHALAITTLHGELGPASADRSPKGWVFFFEVEIWFGTSRENLLVPDISGWRRQRLPDITELQTFDVVPDWVCEGLSPSTAGIDKGRKRELYAKYGVSHLWYANPDQRTIEVYALDGDSYRVLTVVGGEERAVLAPFNHEIDLSRLWIP